MNCFDWQNRVSDYLDGTLMGPVKTEADEHLDSCGKCAERYQHYREILGCIAGQSRSAVPVPIPIRKAPFQGGLPKLELTRLSRSRWEQIPWYLRTSIEGVGIVLMILLGISTGPRLRVIYERSMEANFEDVAQSFRDWRDVLDKSDRTAPLSRGKSIASTETGLNPSMPQAEDFSSGDGDLDSTDEDSAEGAAANVETADGDIHVGSSEIWRFIVKTDSPHEIRGKIVKILTDLKIPPDTSGLGGVEAPGGIQFDLLVPQSIVAGIKRQLQAIAPKAPAELAQTPAGETFTWYKNKSKRGLPVHKTRVVIWLSQM